MLVVHVQMSLLLSQGGGVQVEIPRETRTGAGANLINLLIWSAISVTRKGT